MALRIESLEQQKDQLEKIIKGEVKMDKEQIKLFLQKFSDELKHYQAKVAIKFNTEVRKSKVCQICSESIKKFKEYELSMCEKEHFYCIKCVQDHITSQAYKGVTEFQNLKCQCQSPFKFQCVAELFEKNKKKFLKCQKCQSSQIIDRMITINQCNHMICFERCLVEAAQVAVQVKSDQIKCPVCQVVLDQNNMIYALSDKKVQEIIEVIKFEKQGMHKVEFTCVQCSYINSKFAKIAQTSFSCEICNKFQCIQCKKDGHHDFNCQEWGQFQEQINQAHQNNLIPVICKRCQSFNQFQLNQNQICNNCNFFQCKECKEDHDYMTCNDYNAPYQQQTPIDWYYFQDQQKINLRVISQEEEQYGFVQKYILKTAPAAQITQIQKIVNSIQYKQFTNQVVSLSRYYGQNVTRRLLFYDGDQVNLQNVIFDETGLCYKYATQGQNGLGIYFTSNFSLVKNWQVGKQVLAVDVIIGKSIQGGNYNKNLPQLPQQELPANQQNQAQQVNKRYDCVQDGEMIVIFEDYRCYPQYLITLA